MKKVLILTFLFLSGCVKKGQMEFFDLVKNHKELTAETNTAVISSITDELNSMPDLSENDKKSVLVLIDRLQFSIKQSEVIYNYVLQNDVDSKLISELIRSKWKK